MRAGMLDQSENAGQSFNQFLTVQRQSIAINEAARTAPVPSVRFSIKPEIVVVGILFIQCAEQVRKAHGCRWR